MSDTCEDSFVANVDDDDDDDYGDDDNALQ